jgi:hypothetical protein
MFGPRRIGRLFVLLLCETLVKTPQSMKSASLSYNSGTFFARSRQEIEYLWLFHYFSEELYLGDVGLQEAHLIK